MNNQVYFLFVDHTGELTKSNDRNATQNLWKQYYYKWHVYVPMNDSPTFT